MIYLAAFLNSFAYVSARCFQQLNVTHDRYLWILPCSLLMGLMEVCGIWLVLKSEFWVFIPLGLGGAAGCVVAMVIHKRLRRVSNGRNKTACENDAQGIKIDGDCDYEWR